VEFVLKNMNLEYNDEQIHQVLAKVNMDSLFKSNSYDLSMGQKQRLNIACALCHKPKYLLFDEPTTMIDSYEKENFYNIIKKLKAENYTIVFVTNNATELLLADKIIVVENAQIKDQFSKKSILNKLDMLEQSKIEIPNLLKLLLKLKKKNIKFKLKEWTIEEIMGAIVEAVDNG
jgi:energy-coupling factor transport system ATP-binding protein